METIFAYRRLDSVWGKPHFGSAPAQHLLEDPDVVIQGHRVLHLRYRVRP
jgi:hypothetical protein